MAALDQMADDARPPDALRHGCCLLALIVGFSALALVLVGSVGLVGPLELALVVGTIAGAVVAGDRYSRRRRNRRVRPGDGGPRRDVS